MTFDLSGFKTILRTGIRIETGFNAEINAVLEVSGLQETVTVSGEAPVVDTKTTASGATFSKELLENIPSARDPCVMIEQTPGVVMARQNVGGTASGQQYGWVARGGTAGNAMWNMDGATITDMADSTSPMYYDFDSFEEIQIQTGGNDATLETGGVNINFVHSGSGQAALTMPIMAPLADAVGVTRQTAVLAFQFGEGWINPILPTSGVTMGVLGMAQVPWDKWFRWMLPLQIYFFAVALALLTIAVVINYQ